MAQVLSGESQGTSPCPAVALTKTGGEAPPAGEEGRGRKERKEEGERKRKGKERIRRRVLMLVMW